MEINVKDIQNVVSLQGVVAGYKIERKEAKMAWDDERNGKKKGDPVTQYNGYITVQTAENQFATVNVRFKNENFYDGKPDFTTQALEAMANEEVETYFKTKDFTKTPAIGIYRGVKVVDNYYVSNGELHESLQVELGFGSISLREPQEQPKLVNSFQLNGVVADIQPEIKNDEETGRAVVKVIVPYTYGSKDNQVIRAMMFNMVAGVCEDEEGEYDLGAMLLDDADDVIGYSWQFIGELNNYYLEQEKPQEEGTRRGYGKRVPTQTNRQRISEYLLTGLDILQDGDAFSEEDIAEARQAREASIAEMYKKDEDKQQTQATPSGRGSFASSRTQRTEAPQTEAPAGRSRVRNFR